MVQTLSDQWTQASDASSGYANPWFDCAPDGDISCSVEEVLAVHQGVDIKHAHDGCRAPDGCESKDAGNDELCLHLHLQVPYNEERERAQGPVCGGVDSCDSVRDTESWTLWQASF